MKSAIAGVLGVVLLGAAAWGQVEDNNGGGQVRDWRYVLTIHEIAKADDDVRLGKLLGDNPDRARTRNDNGQTPVHVAAEYGAIKALRALGKAGADFSVLDNGKQTPLTIAVSLNYAQTVKTLVELGADVNQLGFGSTTSGALRTPVSIAARMGAADVMKILLDAKADVSKPDADGSSPLTAAAANQQWEAMNVLLDHAANPDVKDPNGNTALIYAVAAGNLDAAAAVLKHKATPNVKDKNGATPLLIAASAKNEQLVAFLLEQGADVNLADGQGRTPMSATESPAIWKLLAAKGANVNVMVGDATRLEHYIRQGNVEQVKGWLAFKPDPLSPDRQGRTAKELARMYADKPTGTYEGDAARKEIAAVMEEYQKKAWEEREKLRKK
ncbi:MAG: ankyrin repeat domain-containing protein [Phycisphaerales bacterium]|nr:ankyrin repeat domain-containing protein [Phycisphaerales bacterium]